MRNRIREIRTTLGISQEALGRLIGREKALVSKLENGKIKLSQQYMELLAEALACAPADLLGAPTAVKAAAGRAAAKAQGKRPLKFPKDKHAGAPVMRSFVPVYGPAAASKPDKVLITEEYIVDRKPTPQELDNVRDAFIMYVSGDSMFPRYKYGEMVSVHPYRPPSVGHDCVLVYADGNAILKEFQGESEDKREWKLRQYNPDKTFRIKKADVRAIYAVVGRPS